MTTNLQEIEARLKKVILERASQSVRAGDIRSDVALVGEGLALDSVALLEVVVGIEDEFGIFLDDSALTVEQFQALGTLARFIQARLEAEATS